MDGRNVLIGALAVGLAGTGWYALHPETSLRPAEYQSQKSSEPATKPTGRVAADEKADVREYRAQSDEQNARIQALNDKARDLEARLNRSAQDKHDDRDRVADLEKELASTKQELAAFQGAVDQSERQRAAQEQQNQM